MPGDAPSPAADDATRIGLGGGCHWCTEAVFAALRGVGEVAQGYIRAAPPDDAFSEAIALTYRPEEISLDVLIEIHLRTHASTSNHKLRGKYRSAVYVRADDQRRAVEDILTRLQAGFPEPIVTRVLDFAAFEPSDDRFRNYAERNAGNQFCMRYIDPKLDRLRADYPAFLKPA